MATAVSTFPLTITTLPTMQQLHNWWQEMHTDLDDLQVAFNDFTPPTLHEFLRQDLLLALCHLDETIAAAGWLHDLTRDDQGHVVEGWIGGWVAKPCRGQIGMASWQLVLDYLVERGVSPAFPLSGCPHRYAHLDAACGRSRACLAGCRSPGAAALVGARRHPGGGRPQRRTLLACLKYPTLNPRGCRCAILISSESWIAPSYEDRTQGEAMPKMT